MLNRIKNTRIPENPYVLFTPFLVLYIIIVILLQHSQVWGDELRHLLHARNLLKGYYAEPAPNLSFDIGPGYPIILTPFLSFDIPLIWAKLLNAVFQYLSIVFLFKALRIHVSFRISLITAIFWGAYYNEYYNLPLLYTEIFASFLITLFLYFSVKAFSQNGPVLKNKNVWLSGILFGYLALTKVIFCYVLLVIAIVIFILWLWRRREILYKKSLAIFVISFFVISPYLIYTYQLTGRIFYLSTIGGNNLYWMTTPYEGEYGTWFPNVDVKARRLYNLDTIDIVRNNKLLKPVRSFFIPGFEDSVVNNHYQDFIEINKYTGVERDDAFKRIAITNIKNNPTKFVKNCFSNVGRLLFNTPNSYIIQQPGNLSRLPLNGIIAILSLFCLIPTLLNWRRINYSVKIVLCISLVYLGGSIFGSAESRMFGKVVPVLIFWIAYILSKSVKIKLKFNK